MEFTTESRPGEIFEGRIAFIDPVLDEKTRTVPIRVNAPNPHGTLKPGMFVRAVVQSRLDADGNVFDLSLVGKWISPMHPEVVKDASGKCDVCGMDLVPAAELGYSVPSTAPKAAAGHSGHGTADHRETGGRLRQSTGYGPADV